MPVTVTVDLPADVEAGLSALAKAQGLTLPDFLKRVLELHWPGTRSSQTLSRRERVKIWSDINDLPHRPPLSDEAIDRRTIYDQLEA